MTFFPLGVSISLGKQGHLLASEASWLERSFSSAARYAKGIEAKVRLPAGPGDWKRRIGNPLQQYGSEP